LRKEKYKGKTAEEIKAMKAQEKKEKAAAEAKAKKAEAAKTSLRQRPASAAKPKNMARERAQQLQTSWSPDRGPASKEGQLWMRQDKRERGESGSRTRAPSAGASAHQKFEHEKAAMKAVMTLILDTEMTNDPTEIIRIYRENKARGNVDIPGGESEVSRIVNDFFSNENTVKRLVLFKTTLNKSRRRGEVPLYQFYLNMLPDEKKIYMVEKSSKIMVNLKPEEIVTCKAGNKPKEVMSMDEYMCHIYVLSEMKKEEEAAKALQAKEDRKNNTYKKKVLAEVFGESYKADQVKEGDTPEKGITIKNRPDYTVAKDKWKLGNELKKLQAQFPHDRVLQRMVVDEFKTNQPFLYPEEYDIYNQE